MIPNELTLAGQRAATRALATLARAVGADADGDELLDAPGEGEFPLGPIDWLVLAAEARGFELELVEAEIAEVPEWLRQGVPLIGFLDGPVGERQAEAGRWVVLAPEAEDRAAIHSEDADGSQVEDSVPFADLARSLRCQEGRRLRWAIPATALGAPSGEASSDRGQTLHPLRRLLRLLRPDRSDFLAVVIYAVVIGVLLLATPIAVQAVVNYVALGGATSPLIVVVSLLFLGLLLANLLTAFQTWTVEILQRRLFVRAVTELAARLPRVAMDASGTARGPELVNRYFDLQTIQKQGSFLLLNGLSLLLSVLIGLLLLAFYHPYLLIFDVVIVASIAVIVLGPIERGITSAQHESSAKYEMAAWFEEVAANPKLYKSSGVMKTVFERTDRLARRYLEARRRHYRIAFGQAVAALGLQVLASTALLAIGGFLVIRGEMTLGQLVAAELVLALVLSSIAKLGKYLEGFYDLMAATDKLGILLDVPLERSGGEHHFATEAGGAMLEFRDVSWAPPGARTLLTGVGFTAQRGERIGIRGPSGSGKSVLLELAWGMRTPTSGFVRIDGRDLRELSLDSLRRGVALVDGIDIVDLSVRENVLLARPFVSDDAVREALSRVDLLDELAGLPDGLDTRLAADGRPLSVGQLIRLQVARAIASDPRLLLVSDMFPVLDPADRELIFDVLFDRSAPWTLVMVSTSPEALERCDRTFDLDAGRLVAAESAALATAP